MTEDAHLSREERQHLEERIRKVSMDKSYLQLVVGLIQKMSEVPGLERVVENMLRSVAEVIGGTNIIIYYWVDDEVHRADLFGLYGQIAGIADDLVGEVVEKRVPLEIQHDFQDTRMVTAEFGKAYTWVFPLLVGHELVGVIKLENLHIGMRDLYEHLPAFFNYAALVLKNEIRSQTRLQKAFSALSLEIAARKQAETGLLESKAELENRVAERTAALSEANRQLSIDIAERRQTEETMAFLLQCGLPTTGEDFFRSLARYLAQQLEMDYVCIDRLVDGDLTAETVAIYYDGAFEPNVTYALKDTPCGRLLDRGVCCFSKDVRALFPADAALEQLQAESYVGTVLGDSKGRPNGLIAVIGRHPLLNPQRAESLLRMVAPRAAGELERRQVEAAIAENEARLRKISSMISDIAYSCAAEADGVYSIRWMMGGIERVTGYTTDEIMAFRCWGGLVVEADRRLFSANVAGLAPGAQGFCELRIRHKSGAIVWLASRAECVLLEGGHGAMLYGALVDITERKRAEEQQAFSRRLLQDVIDHAQYLVYAKDLEGRYILASRSLAEFLGEESHERLLGKTSHDFLSEEVADRQWSSELAVMENGSLVQEEETLEGEDGAHSFISTKFPLFDLDGRMFAVGGASVDITKRKRAEEALRASEERHRTVLHTAMDGFLMLDMVGRVLEVNDSYCRMTGFSEEEVLRSTIHDLEVVESGQDTAAQIARLVERREDRFETRHRTKDGGVVDIEVSVQYRPIEGGRMLAFLRNITERKRGEEEKARLETQLQQAQKMEAVGRLAGGVAHDFNNMLQAILGNVDLALDEIPEGNAARDSIEEIGACAGRSADLTRQLLAFARRQTVAPRVLDLNDTVGGMLRMLERLIGEGTRLTWRPGDALWSTKVDPSQVDQILANLCVNARDAIGDVGEITIETENRAVDEDYCAAHAGFVPGEYVRLAVSDNGCGMDKLTMSHIFEPFFTTKGPGEGTGLGLATVYGIVKQNNGLVNVYSEVGTGTTFSVYLPRHVGKPVAPGAREGAEPILGGKETILLVEDEKTILNLTTRILTKQGYRVLAASNPGEAIKMAAEHEGDIDLLLTDVIMPEMNGRELARNILTLYPNIKRLFMSGYTANVIAHHGVLDPGIHFIQKPFSMKGLTTKIRSALND